MKILDYLKQNKLYLDGGMGTLLQAKGLTTSELPETWNLTHPDIITDIHRAYYDAGSNVVSANTFGANALKFSHAELEDVIRAAFENAKLAKDTSLNPNEKFIALDIGPSGRMLKPYGDLDFEDAVSLFGEVVRLGAKYGADLIFIETMNDCYETKAALLAAKENCDLPVFVSNVYGSDTKLMTGATPAAMVAMIEGMGADAIGANCSLGPEQLSAVVDELLKYCSVPVLLKPNAGLPKIQDGKTVYDISPCVFAKKMAEYITRGVRIVGGCCGTTPEYIGLLHSQTYNIQPSKTEKKHHSLVSSYTHALEIGKAPILIGERINPTGKSRIKLALHEGDMGFILREGISQEEAGAHMLDVNVGLPEIDEPAVMKKAVCELQAVTALPLQIDTSNALAMEAALRRYNGKAMINSVNGKAESMREIFPLAKKYGGVIVALTLDENGIPDTVDGRIEIAKKILRVATEYGIDKKDIIFDTLTMAVSADSSAALVTLDALRRIHDELDCNTVLGVSNISFGLPCRDVLNGAFFTAALQNYLSAAIMNPHCAEMMKVYYAHRALTGLDKNCLQYIHFASRLDNTVSVISSARMDVGGTRSLYDAVVKGLKEQASQLTEELLKTNEPLAIVNEQIIPALDFSGREFESQRIYLPSLLMSAEAAKCAFDKIKTAMISEGKKNDRLCIVIATVKGDIHDIGKNIVALLLENYGFRVIDLGKDVDPETILDAARKHGARIVGLSALMTTTVPAMEQTIKLLRASLPEVKIMVGGAVLNEQYAEMIGADAYTADAMCSVRYAESVEAVVL